MIRRFLCSFLAVALAASVYMPYAHEPEVRAEAPAAHEGCVGHDTGSDTSHVSDCLSKILLKNVFELAFLPPPPIRGSYAALFSRHSFFLAPDILASFARAHSPPSFFGLSARPAAFIAATVLRI